MDKQLTALERLTAALGTKPKPLGRPVGVPYPVKKFVRLRDDDADDLDVLTERWRCSEAEAIRRSIREAAKRESAG